MHTGTKIWLCIMMFGNTEFLDGKEAITKKKSFTCTTLNANII